MNREEAIKIIKKNRCKIIKENRRDFYALGWNIWGEVVNEYDKAVEVLEQPPTLEDFLGWEEGVEYKCLSGKYKVVDGELLYYWNLTQEYEPAKAYLNRSNILAMRQAEKVEHKKKYRIPLPNLVTTDGMQQYLTEKNGYWFASRLNETLKQEWTEDEYHRIPSAYWGYVNEVVD